MRELHMKSLLLLLILGAALGGNANAEEIAWNGFGSAFYGQAFDSDLMPGDFSDKRADFTTFSLMGLNLAASIQKDLGFAAQLVALGSPIESNESYALMGQWAYVHYTPWEGSSFKMGRQLFPATLASEYVRVGYLLPFRQIPSNFYSTFPFTRFDGASASQSRDTGAGALTFGVFGGKPLLDINSTVLAAYGLTFEFADLIGATVTLDGKGWRVRAQASRVYAELQTSAPMPVSTYAAIQNFYSVGYRFDKSGFVS